MSKPRVFIGSSSEALAVAYAIQANLERDAEITVWSQGVFEPSQYILESLAETLASVDFGIFVFAADDVVRMRKKTMQAVRDNVLFELGLCVGVLGRRRSFIVKPRLETAFRLPTDLLGLTPAEYQSDRSDENWRAAVGPACAAITAVIRKLGCRGRDHDPLDTSERQRGTAEYKTRAARYLRACESAAGAAREVEDRNHPEWRELSVGLEIGRFADNKGLSVLYVKSSYQTPPGEKTFTFTWHKWYIGISKPDEPTDTYVLFEELPRLLKRPGELSFETDSAVPKWIRKSIGHLPIVGVLYCDRSNW